MLIFVPMARFNLLYYFQFGIISIISSTPHSRASYPIEE